MTNTAGERNTEASLRNSKRRRVISPMLRLNTWTSLGASLPLKRSVWTVIAEFARTNGTIIVHNVLIVLCLSRLSDSYPIVSMAKDLER